jgi:hypothetical protein
MIQVCVKSCNPKTAKYYIIYFYIKTVLLTKDNCKIRQSYQQVFRDFCDVTSCSQVEVDHVSSSGHRHDDGGSTQL